jgi:thioredoxin 1
LQAYAGNLKVVKVEADGNKPLLEQYKVYGLPALLVMKDGQVMDGSVVEGAITKAMLVKKLEALGFTQVAATV